MRLSSRILIESCACLRGAMGIIDLLDQVKDEKGWTALHICAWKDNSHVADVLLRSGRCNVNEQTNNGNTALHWVSEQGVVACCAIGSTALQISVDRRHTNWLQAAQKDHRSMAEMLLLQKSIDVDAQNVLGQAPLHICACYGSLAVAKVLLRCKVSHLRLRCSLLIDHTCVVGQSQGEGALTNVFARGILVLM